MIKQIAKNSSYLVISATVVKISFFVWSALVARLLGNELFGEYSYLTSSSLLFTSLPDLGIGLILIRQLSRQPQLHLQDWLIYRRLNHWLALISIPFMYSAFQLYSTTPHLTFPVLLAGTLFALAAMRSPYLVLLQAHQSFKTLAICELVNVITPILFSLLALLVAPTTTYLFTGQIIGMLMSVGLVVLLSQPLYSKTAAPTPKHQTWALVRSALPLGLAAFFGMIVARVDQLLIVGLLSTSQLGVFAVANSIITGIVGIFANTFTQTTLPVLAVASSVKNIFKLTSFSLIGSLLLTLSIFIFSPLVINLGFGSSYQAAIPLAQIMGLSLVFLFFNRLFEQVLLVKHKEWYYLLSNLIGAIMTISLNLLLITHLNLPGAAWAKVISQFLMSVILGAIICHLKYSKSIPLKTMPISTQT